MKVTQLFKSVSAVAMTAILASCSVKPLPLDPSVGDTGQPLSAVALKSDVQFYDLSLEVFLDDKRIKGVSKTQFKMLSASQFVELKLDSRFLITAITSDDKTLNYTRNAGVLNIDLGKQYPAGSTVNVAVAYEGNPHIAKNAPWDGGFVFAETESGEPWIATAVQGEGCDLF